MEELTLSERFLMNFLKVSRITLNTYINNYQLAHIIKLKRGEDTYYTNVTDDDLCLLKQLINDRRKKSNRSTAGGSYGRV